MGLDIHWANKPDDSSDANQNPATGTWMSINSAGCEFFRAALSTLTMADCKRDFRVFNKEESYPPGCAHFPYSLNSPAKAGALDAILGRFRELLKLPDGDARMNEWAEGLLDPSYPWRQAIEDMLVYLDRAHREGDGIIVY